MKFYNNFVWTGIDLLTVKEKIIFVTECPFFDFNRRHDLVNWVNKRANIERIDGMMQFAQY